MSTTDTRTCRPNLLAVIVCCLCCLAAAPAKVAPDDPGLLLTITTADARPDARVTRLAALYVPAGAPASSLQPAGAFSARFDGSLA
ncbi:MAG: hypothetical protein ACHRHE_00410, partial [Tepidisphaerales bacterium]